MRLSEALRLGYAQGFTSLCRKRGRVSLEELLDSSRARAPPVAAALEWPASRFRSNAGSDKGHVELGIQRTAGCPHSAGGFPATAAGQAGPSTPASSSASAAADNAAYQSTAEAPEPHAGYHQSGCTSTRNTLPGSEADCSHMSQSVQLAAAAQSKAIPQQQQQQQQQLPQAAHQQAHQQAQQQLPGVQPPQLLQVAGWAAVEDMQQGQLQSDLEFGSDEEEFEYSEGTSDFEDAYSDYGTTEEEEENNSIPPAELEAIMQQNAALWMQTKASQQQQQQQSKQH